jgi:predicted secreted protein
LRLLRIIGVLVLAAALGACSAIKLGYANLPELGYWWIDRYLDFDEAQSRRVRAELHALHAWHRKQELPKVVALLGQVERALPGPVSARQACDWFSQLQDHLRVVADHAEPAVVATAMTLSPKQLRHLQRQYRKRDDDWRKDWIEVPAAEQKDKRFDQLLERAEMIYGRLDSPQRDVLRGTLEGSPFDAARVLAEREKRQQDMLETLRRVTTPGLSVDDARKLMRGAYERSMLPADPASRQYQQAMIDDGCRSFAALHASTTPQQRDQAVRRLRAWQRDLGELAAQP